MTALCGELRFTYDIHWLAARLYCRLIIKLQQGDCDRGNHQQHAEDQKVPLNVQPQSRQHSSDHRASDRTNPRDAKRPPDPRCPDTRRVDARRRGVHTDLGANGEKPAILILESLIFQCVTQGSEA